MTRDAFLKTVCAAYPGADFYNHVAAGKTLEMSVLQYHDTDWELMKREVSKEDQGLFVDAKLPSAKIHYGTPPGQDRGEMEQFDFIVSKSPGDFSQDDQNQYKREINEFDFMEYTIWDKYAAETFGLGDRVTYNGITLYIREAKSEIKDNKLYNTYKLTTQNGLKQPHLLNGEIQGLSIPGKVSDVEKNRLKLHLIIDEEQPVETACWFDYAAYYATWYGMPEIGDYVNLHFPTRDETRAIGINSFKQNPEYGYTRNNGVKTPANTSAAGNKGPIDFVTSASDPKVKMLTTESGRMIELGPDRLCVLFSDDTYFVLDESDGMKFATNRDGTWYAAGEVNINAQERVHIQAKEKISLQSESSVIEITPSAITVMSENKDLF